MGITWRRRWGGQSVGVRCALVVYAIGFAEGTRAHVADLVRGGLGAYSTLGPVALQMFFISLVVVDPIVVLLVVLARRAGVLMGLAVMALDVPANLFVGWPTLRHDWWWLVRPTGALPLTLFGLFVFVSAIPLSRRLAGARSTA